MMPRHVLLCAGLILSTPSPASSGIPEAGGPYNANFLEGGIGIERTLPADSPVLTANPSFSISTWVRPLRRQKGAVALVALGLPAPTQRRCLVLQDGRPGFWAGSTTLLTRKPIAAGRWTHLALTAKAGRLRLYVDGREVASAKAMLPPAMGLITIAPADGLQEQPHFGGSLVAAKLEDVTRPAEDIARQAAAPPQFDLVQMRDVGVGWPLQKQANIGLTETQDAWLLPHGAAAASAPVAKPIEPQPSLTAIAPDTWQVNDWRMIAAPLLGIGDGAPLSLPGVDTTRWYRATVPGTVLTTLVDRGVYPDPYYGLNNLAIPESLARQDYWFRASFAMPATAAGKRVRLVFGGINYTAEIWINGQRAGQNLGAFTRATFAFDARPENIVAVRVRPPPHPGIPHEQSIKGGAGENGGQLAIDGPTFVATEGWDWIPGIRDRNTGLWQPVTLEATGDVRILDPQVITDLPLPQTDSADVHIAVRVSNDATSNRRTTVTAKFDNLIVSRTVDLPPGLSDIRFSPATDPALRIRNPKLWWPNGYGDPVLHDLGITATVDGLASHAASLRFGIREISYELSLFDSSGALRRVDVHTTDAALRGERLIDVSHAGIKRSPLGWTESLTSAGETSPAVRDIPATYALPHLALRVNGIRIAARGGNWGMDDAMKHIGRERLAPYFRLEREAHMNVIRNWMGTNTEPEFYDLADENGMMVLNDFWASTQNFQVEPQDPKLFLANARDVIKRYRNHPSIVLWFGRNEGVPYPLLNQGLDDLVAELDGTRWYTGSSNEINLQGSGPYNYRPPEGYFTDLASGFSVETGTPSLSTLEAIKASIPATDRWPLSDSIAYHDWHFSGNGNTASFMAAMTTMFGAPTGLADFERKAQMMNLETHKAIFEGFLGHLWTKNSGRLMWMTHPSWPSNAWQLYSSDYDTGAAYYGGKKAAEPVHIQLNLPDKMLVVVNTSRVDRTGLKATVRVVGLDNREYFTRTDMVDARSNQVTSIAAIALESLFQTHPMLLVKLELRDASGALVSGNFYWSGRDMSAYRALGEMPPVVLTAQMSASVRLDQDLATTVTITNNSRTPALNVKLTLIDQAGARILPAYYDDNYLALLPGETRAISVRYPATVKAKAMLAIRGWNVAATPPIAPLP